LQGVSGSLLVVFVLSGVSLERGVSLEANRRGGLLNLRRVLAFEIASGYPEKGACKLTGNFRNAGKIYLETIPLLRNKVESCSYCDRFYKLNLQGSVKDWL
jgi:hypothetical protein